MKIATYSSMTSYVQATGTESFKVCGLGKMGGKVQEGGSRANIECEHPEQINGQLKVRAPTTKSQTSFESAEAHLASSRVSLRMLPDLVPASPFYRVRVEACPVVDFRSPLSIPSATNLFRSPLKGSVPHAFCAASHPVRLFLNLSPHIPQAADFEISPSCRLYVTCHARISCDLHCGSACALVLALADIS